MKKSIKILALILTLALVCGAFVIGAFAADDEAAHVGYDYSKRETVTGETIINYMDYEQCSPKNFGLATEVQDNNSYEHYTLKSNNGLAAMLIYGGRRGEASIVTSAKGAENKYLEVTMSERSVGPSAGPYQTFTIENIASPYNADKALNYWSMADVKYLVVDADVFFPAAISGTPDIHIEYRGYDKNGTRNFTKEFGFDTTGERVAFASDYTANGEKISQDKWTHVTYIVKSEVKTDDNGEYLVLTNYLALDGKLTSYKTVMSGEGGNPANEKNGDRTNVYPLELRLSWANVADGTQYLSDNVAIRKFDANYDGSNLEVLLAKGDETDMTAWDGNVYDASNMPYGKTVATREVDGEIVEYDNLQKAVNEAEEEETITLVKSVADEVVVEKALYIDGTDAGYTCEFAQVDGYSNVKNGNIYVIEPATEGLTVYWYPCDCGNDCFEEAEIVVYEGNSIYEAYKAAMGYYPTCNATEDPETHAKKSLAGFTDVTGIIENFTTSTVVTADMVGETIELEPVYETIYPVGMKISAAGNATYYYDSASFLSMFGGAGNNATIKLLANLEINALTGFNHTNVTLDLNGYRIASIQANGVNKRALFQAKGKILNVTSTATDSVGTLYHVQLTGSASDPTNGDPVFNAGANGTVNLYGADEKGNTTLRIYTAVLFNDWTGNCHYNIDGGEYYRTGSDHTGLIYARGTGTGTFKNAYIYGADAVFSMCGVGTAAAGGTGTYTIDNCVLEARNISLHTYEGLSVTFTNSYLNGVINPTTKLNNDVKAATGITHTIGEGCFIKTGVVNDNVNYAGEIYPVSVTKTVTDYRNDFAAADIFATTALETTTTYDRYVAAAGLEKIEIIWVGTDGRELGRSTALPGFEATAPATPVEGTNGMVMASYSDWVGGTLIPADAEDGYTITLAEGSDVTYTAGVVDIQFNFTMVGHYQYNYYLPAVEGITYTGVNRNGSAGTVPAPAYTAPDGTKYSIVNIWPSAHNTDDEYTFSVTYTYEGVTLEYIAPTVSMTKYVNYILTNEKYAEYEEIKTMFADMMRVIEQANIAAGKTTNDAFKTVYAMAEPYMSKTEDVIDKTATNDFSSVEDYLEDVKLVYHSGLGAMTVAITAKDGYYGLVAGKNTVYGAAAIGDNREINNGGVIYGHNVRSYALTEVLVISFYNKADVDTSNSQIRKANAGATPVATVEFTMAGLVNDNYESYNDATKALVDAFFTYSMSSREYMDWRARNFK